MVRKNWKLVERHRGYSRYENEETGDFIEVIKLKIVARKDWNWIVSKNDRASLGYFRTQKQALRFARGYMRKH